MSFIDRFSAYIQDKNNWIMNNSIDDDYMYYDLDPSFLLIHNYKSAYGKTGYVVYALNLINPKPNWVDIYLKYNNTIIKHIDGLYLEDMNYLTPCPNMDSVKKGYWQDESIVFPYFVKNSLEYNLNILYFNELEYIQRTIRKNLFENILVFESIEEKNDFKEYVEFKWNSENAFVYDFLENNLINLDEQTVIAYKEQLLDIAKLQKMLNEFRSCIKPIQQA